MIKHLRFALLLLGVFIILLLIWVPIWVITENTAQIGSLNRTVNSLHSRISELQADVRANDQRISGNAVAIDYALSVSEACADRLGVKINIPTKKGK